MDKIEIMNLGLTDSEFCHRLWQENPDPVITRLLSIIGETAEWREDMIKYDEPWEITHHINELQNETDYLNEQLIEANDKLHKLEARTVIELLEKMRKLLADKEDDNKHLQLERERADRRTADMESKMNMWAVLNK